ncbi:MAG: alpha-N-acetylglucosaminidase [Alphaproteobacteria bacterium]|nr:alpha-N-acetylglucosaminidase [Alphaproteobacteria bacterium]
MASKAFASSTTVEATQEVLWRLLGARANGFDLKLDEDAGALPFFEVRSRDGVVRITANAPAGLLRGACAYLSAIGAFQMNWEGDRAELPPRWPDLTIARSSTIFRHRAYLNPCAYGYTTPFWDWERWQREIGWMALHGVDMPIAMEGQEYVWRQLWADAGLSATELAGYFCGPAFLPWQRMGNIEGHGGPLPLRWIEKKRDLQLRILDRIRGIGMTPILPAFAGYVPKAFANRHPEAHIHKMTPWGGFHETYWLDPTDPLFASLARDFLDRNAAVYGKGQYYLADAFNEMRPPVADKSPAERATVLSLYGRSLFDSLKAANPDAVLTMQGWLFGIDPGFWDEQSVQAFLRDIPDEKVLILDIANDTFRGVWEKNRAFSGKSWIFGYIHDFGGNNPLFGDLVLTQQDLGSLPARTDTGHLQGFGVFPEGLNTNSVVYDYMFDMAWPTSGGPTDVDGWMVAHLKARYGKTDPALLAAWADLWRAVYQTPNWRTGWWRGSFGQYLFCKRPDRALAGFGREPGNLSRLRSAVATLAGLSHRYADSALFLYDLVAAVCHYATLQLDLDLLTCIRAFEARDGGTADKAWRKVRSLSLMIDALLGVQPQHLAGWIDEAEGYAQTPEEARLYVENAKMQITVWGGDGVLKDYASKAWHGMYRYYYLPRWVKYIDAQRRALRSGREFDQAHFTDELVRWEFAWATSGRRYARRRPKRPQLLVDSILAQC